MAQIEAYMAHKARKLQVNTTHISHCNLTNSTLGCLCAQITLPVFPARDKQFSHLSLKARVDFRSASYFVFLLLFSESLVQSGSHTSQPHSGSCLFHISRSFGLTRMQLPLSISLPLVAVDGRPYYV